MSVVASADPVIPGQSFNYTITLRNNGPAAAVNGGVNVNLDQNLTLLSTSVPAGFSCPQFGNNVTCSRRRSRPAPTRSRSSRGSPRR